MTSAPTNTAASAFSATDSSDGNAPSRPQAWPGADSLPARPDMRFLHRPAPKRSRALAVAAALMVIAGVAVPVAAAIPGVATLFSAGEAIVLDRVESTTMVVAGENALVVTGTLTNPTARELPVPAVKVALRAGNDDDAFAWTVEPASSLAASFTAYGLIQTLATSSSTASRQPATIWASVSCGWTSTRSSARPVLWHR